MPPIWVHHVGTWVWYMGTVHGYDGTVHGYDGTVRGYNGTLARCCVQSLSFCDCFLTSAIFDIGRYFSYRLLYRPLFLISAAT